MSSNQSEEPQSPVSDTLPTARTALKRHSERGSYDQDTVRQIVDEAFLAHVGLTAPEGPIVLPMVYGRHNDTLYLHGSTANALLRRAQEVEICATITLVDGLVLARSAFHHSMNFRSVVVRGSAKKVEGDEKELALKLITNHIVDRWDDCRQPEATEIKQTLVVSIPLTESSAKIRTGDPVDAEKDLAGPWWAGLVPYETNWGQPTSSLDLAEPVAVPDAVKNM